MDHHRLVLGVVGARVGEPEAHRHVVVELDRADLPRAAERVGHVQVDLRAVERAVARVEVVGEALAVEHLDQVALGAVPQLVGADPLVGAGRELEPHVEAEDRVGGERELEARLELVLDLLLGAEDVAVVLGEVPRAQQPVQRAAQLVAVQQPRLGVADGQVAVGVRLQSSRAGSGRGSSSA